MSTTKSVRKLEERIEMEQKRLLEANGWSYGMWRWFWVWRKDAGDAAFVCMTVDEAMRVERAIQSSADIYPKAATGSAA